MRSAFASALATRRLARVIDYHEVIPTTMERAASLVREGGADGTVVVADHQTAGRGRRGRSWGYGPPGSLFMASWVLSLETARAALFTVLSVVSLLRAAEALGVEKLSVKWPNDLLLGGKKVAGVLSASVQDERAQPWLVLGTGVDVHTREHPEEVRELITSFARSGYHVDRLAFLARAAVELEALVDGGEAAALARWKSASAVLGRLVRVDNGAGAFEAEAVDLDADGALLVRRGGSLERIVAGDVSVRPA